MATLERFHYILLAALLATLAFEFRFVPILSNLQWLFVGLCIVAAPILFREQQRLLQNRLVVAALAFVGVQWISAFMAPDFTYNAVKSAIRISTGFIILCASLCVRDRGNLKRVWAIAAVAAALYGIADLAGFGAPGWFRDGNFYYANVTRLSGSFEYPNTAAAFFALSLPIVCTAAGRGWIRVAGTLVVWMALILTYSRGAAFAVLAMLTIWAVLVRSKTVIALLLLCAGVFAAAMVTYPTLARRFLGLDSHHAFSVQYEPEFNLLRRSPNRAETFLIRLRNNGTVAWTPMNEQPFWLRYRWFDPVSKKVVLEPHGYTVVPVPVEPGASVLIEAPLLTPPTPGLYILTWDLFGRQTGWFSARGIFPAVIDVEIHEGVEPWSGHGDVSRWYRRDISRAFVSNDPFERLELWKAGLQMFLERPLFGVGLDNFRLLLGKHLDITEWDTNIRANSLYIELLAGSGLAGLLAFAAMMGAVRWKLEAASVALGIFLIHGIVDVFLMTTPIYFAFWFLLGQAGRQPLPEASVT
jgi:O-antigen ligase